MRTFLRSAMVAALAAVTGVPLAAQVVQDTGGITRQQADDILKELRQIRQLLERPPAPAARAPQEEAPVHARIADLSGVSMIGSKTAPLTIVEFTDYQCPFCQRFHVTAFSDLKKNYIDTGKVRFFSKDMPLDFHANAMRAAQAARCAGEQGKFWELRDVMGANPDKLDMNQIALFATDLHMDAKQLRSCVESEKYKAVVQNDVLEAMRIGATGTPTFVIGRSAGDGVDGDLLVGSMPFQLFDEKLKALAAK